VRQPDLVQEVRHAFVSCLAFDLADGERFGKDLLDGHGRVQRRIRVLEHHLDLVAEFLALGTGGLGDFFAAVFDTAAGHPGEAQRPVNSGLLEQSVY